MQVFTLREVLKTPSKVLGAAKEGSVVIISRTFGQFTIKPTQLEIEITKTIKKQ